MLLAFLHLLAPLPNGLWNGRDEPWLVVFPIAAVSIYLMKRWSYALYLACMGCAIYANYVTARSYPSLAFELGMVGYFLIPAVRAGFFNPRLRWWETKPRYAVRLKALAAGLWGREHVNLLNLSEGGAFVRASVSLQRGDKLELSFEALDQKVQVQGHVVHMSGGESWGYGIQFDMPPALKQQLRDLVRALARSGLKDTRSTAMTFEDFKSWVIRLVTSGKGWIPEIPIKTEAGIPIPAQDDRSSEKKAA